MGKNSAMKMCVHLRDCSFRKGNSQDIDFWYSESANETSKNCTFFQILEQNCEIIVLYTQLQGCCKKFGPEFFYDSFGKYNSKVSKIKAAYMAPLASFEIETYPMKTID